MEAKVARGRRKSALGVVGGGSRAPAASPTGSKTGGPVRKKRGASVDGRFRPPVPKKKGELIADRNNSGSGGGDLRS